MTKHKFTILLVMIIHLSVQSQELDLVAICDKDDRQPLIGVNLVSLDFANKGLISDFNGVAELSLFDNSEIVMLTYLGYESVLISVEYLSRLDTIYLRQGPAGMTLGSTGILPTMTVNVFIPQNCGSEQKYITQTTLKEDRQLLVDEFVRDLKTSCKKCQNVVVNFNIDNSGNLVEFIIHNFEYIRSKQRIESIISIGKGLLLEQKCFGVLANIHHDKYVNELNNYQVILE